MNYIFILFGADSTYEAQLMSKFIDEMPETTNVFCFISDIPEVYIKKTEKVFKIINQSRDLNESSLNTILTEGQISAVFIFDFHKIFFTSEYGSDYKILNFDLRWLEKVNAPINIIDPLDYFEYTNDKKVKLRFSSKYNPDNYSPETEMDLLIDDNISLKGRRLQSEEDTTNKKLFRMFDNKDIISSRYDFYPNIIKVSPPSEPPIKGEQEEEIKDDYFYWNYSNVDYENQDTDRMRAPLGMNNNAKNIFLMFSPAMQIQGLIRVKPVHYARVVNTVIEYLKMLDTEVNLFISSFDKSPEIDAWIKGSKIKYKTFVALGYDMYKTLILYCDALITDTPWNPALIDAACLQKPAGVIGNSFHFDETGQAKSAFDYTAPKIMKILEIATHNTPDELFPFIAFPIKEENDIIFGFHDEKYPYYLLDIYNTESVMAFLDEFVIRKDEVTDNLVKFQHFFAKRGEKSFNTEQILGKFE